MPASSRYNNQKPVRGGYRPLQYKINKQKIRRKIRLFFLYHIFILTQYININLASAERERLGM